MTSVWIFGDSYAHPHDADYAWTNLLKNKGYKIQNCAYRGTGPDYQLSFLKKLIDGFDTDFTKNVTVIFLISSVMRFNFKFYDDPHDQVIQFDNHWASSNQHANQLYKKYKKYHKFVKTFYQQYIFHSTYTETELEKILGYLYLQSNNFNKILAWPIFDEVTMKIPYNKRFYIPSKKMFDLEADAGQFGDDFKLNHLSKPKHYILADQLDNWIRHNKRIDFDKFNKK